MSETNNKLEIKKLSKRFGEKILFENLSLTVDDPAVLWAPSGWGQHFWLQTARFIPDAI